MGVTTFSAITLSIVTPSITTFSLMTLSIMIFSTIDLIITLRINYTHHDDTWRKH
jgi:hypothetical protein